MSWRLALTLALMLCAGAAQAQTGSALRDLLDRARAERASETQKERARVEALGDDPVELRRQLAELDAGLAQARARSAQLNAEFDANERALDAAEAARDEALGDLAALFAGVRQQATDVGAVIASSPISAQLPDRLALLEQLGGTGPLPTLDELDRFRLLMLEEMVEQSRVVRFEAQVFDARGQPRQAEVNRVGAFSLSSGDRFLLFDPATGSVTEPGRQPQARYRNDAAALAAAQGGVVRMAIDPSYGALLQALVRKPDLAERIAQGGVVGYIILALGGLGLMLALWRTVALLISRAGIGRQLQRTDPDTRNPLGRVLQVFHQHPDAGTEALELRLDEAILRETPRLERFQGALKVIAAVSPLLGLLGTVIGMIETFQSITVYGTGDPRLMADGISKALVTTMFGLFVAIPLVLLHSLVASLSKGQVEILEAHSAGIVARQVERRP